MNCCRRRRQSRFVPEPALEEVVEGSDPEVCVAVGPPEEAAARCSSESGRSETTLGDPSGDLVAARVSILGLDLLALDARQRSSLEANLVGEIMCIVGEHAQAVQDTHAAPEETALWLELLAAASRLQLVAAAGETAALVAAEEIALVVASRLRAVLEGEAAARRLVAAAERELPPAARRGPVRVEVAVQSVLWEDACHSQASPDSGSNDASAPKTALAPASPRFCCALDLPKPSLAPPRSGASECVAFDLSSAARFEVVEFANSSLQEPAPSLWAALVELCCTNKQDPAILCMRVPAKNFARRPVDDDSSSWSRMSL